MEYIVAKLRDFSYYFVKRVEENKERKTNKLDIYFEQVYKVLSWEDNTFTLIVFLVLHFLFWLLVQWQIHFFGMVFFTILIIFTWDTYVETMDLQVYRNKYCDAFEEVRCCIHDVVLNLKALRRESPSSFCIGMSLTFLTINFVARSISGYLIMYLIILAIFFIPLGFKLLPEEYANNVTQFLRVMGNVRGVLAEEELLPFILNKDFGHKDNDLDSLLTDRTADSATNSFASGISAMPSYLDVAEIQADIEEEDLLPSRLTQEGVSYTPGELSSDSDSERNIHFDTSHFNADSSSEEEKVFGKGLKFSASDVLDTTDKNWTSHIGLGGAMWMANALKSAITAAPTQRKDSSSESEFEIINSDEIRD